MSHDNPISCSANISGQFCGVLPEEPICKAPAPSDVKPEGKISYPKHGNGSTPSQGKLGPAHLLAEEPSKKTIGGWSTIKAAKDFGLTNFFATLGNGLLEVGRSVFVGNGHNVIGGGVAFGCEVSNRKSNEIIPDPESNKPPENKNRSRCPEGMVYIPGGSFMMGGDFFSGEQPTHPVEVSGLCVDRYEFTNGDRDRLMGELDGKLAASLKRFAPPKGFDAPEQPLIEVSWEEADTLCKLQGKRLPTEAEWEYLARGISHADNYSTADGKLTKDGKKQAHFDYNQTAKVGSYAPNSFGVYDLTGNVWEWTADWYGPYDGGLAQDPKGPAIGKEKVLRGGAWYDCYPMGLRAAYRFGYNPDFRYYGVGFRGVADPLE